MKRAWLAGVLLLAGCGGDPSRDPLKSGAVVEMHGDPEKLAVAEGKMRTHALVELGDWVAYGTRMRVLSDPGPGESSTRNVSVLVIEGEGKDRTISVERSRLRVVN